jgi:soluble lytic murein transglycosylase-like protein
MISRFFVVGCTLAACILPAMASGSADRPALDELVSQHAKANGIPEALVHRVIKHESNYNPRASRGGNLGLMQIRYGTARALGYTGPAAGLLDANTNLAYGVAYLANAYTVAGGDRDRAVSLFKRGYYYEAKRKGLLKMLRTGGADPVVEAKSSPAESPSPASWFSSLFTREEPQTNAPP